MRRFRGLFADHVDMRLNDDARMILIAFRCVLIDHDVVHVVLYIAQAVRFGKIHDPVAQALFVLRAMRNLGDFIEVVTMRLSQIKFHIFHPPCKRIRAQNPQQNVMRDFASFFIILPNTAKPYSFVSGFSYTPNNKMPLL